ncbi:MAG: hypothetical protein EWM51_02040 [Treponema sp.]|nr:MAG: hypothetical protein EWM51_02040 [Treponema sp.]
MKTSIFRSLLAAAVCFGLLSAAAAQDASFFEDDLFGDDMFSDDALFGGDSSGVEPVSGTGSADSVGSASRGTAAGAVSTFLKTEGVRIGGNWSGSVSPAWTWTDPWHDGFELDDFDARSLSADVGAKVFFDARPNEDTRFYGAFKTSWPFGEQADIGVFELFGDRVWNDRLFFRFGKHTVKWGVGYFWSPADVVNITEIDPTDPEAQLEGPVSLRVHMPVPGTQTNFWAYAIVPPSIEPAALVPEDIAYAGKLEFLLGNYEIGAGAFWQRDLAPKAMLTATGSLWRFNLFGEFVAGWGSDKKFVKNVATSIPELPAGPITFEKDDNGVYVSATAGFMYMDSKNDFTAAFQYFYNGDGYSDSARKDLIKDSRDLVALLETLPPGTVPGLDSQNASYMMRGLVANAGLHYAGVSLSKTGLADDKLSVSVFAMASLSDLSGMAQPSVSWNFFDGFSASLNPLFWWSADALWGAGNDGEYVILSGGPSVSLSFKATLGSGKF